MSYRINTNKSWSATQQDLTHEFNLWGIKEWDTNYPRGARFEGFSQTEEERTVTIWYQKDGKKIQLSMGKQPRAVDNLRVLFLVINALRLNEVRQMSDVFESAYLQLAAPEQFNPYEILGVYENQPIEVIEAAFKAQVQKNHPDKGGDPEVMKKLNKAIEIIRKQKNT